MKELINLLPGSVRQYQSLHNSCMNFSRGHLGCSTAGAAVLLMPFCGLKEKGGHIFSSPTVLTIKPQVPCKIKDLEPRACTVSSSLLGH